MRAPPLYFFYALILLFAAACRHTHAYADAMAPVMMSFFERHFTLMLIDVCRHDFMLRHLLLYRRRMPLMLLPCA